MDWAGSPLSTRDTVDTCTPAAWAISTSRDARRRAPPATLADGAPGGPAPGGPAPAGAPPGGAPPGIPDLAGFLRAGPARMGPPPADIPEVMTNHPADRASSGTATIHHEHAALQVTRAVRGQKRNSVGDL